MLLPPIFDLRFLAPIPAMWLFIDTHAPGSARYGWLERDARVKLKRLNGRTNRLLPRLDALLRERRGKVRGICVVTGPGSFTSIRTGALYANLLSRLLRLPLYAVRREDAEDPARLAARLASGALPPVSYAPPVYDAEPNITVRKC